jgi:multiple antibiotic resistance protein
MSYFIVVLIKFFFLLTPFFVVSMFLSMTRDLSGAERHKLALRLTLAIILICTILYFFGATLFMVFGITEHSFRVGAGALLFLTAVSLVRGGEVVSPAEQEGDIAVVPLAIPVTVGPATTGALLVMGADAKTSTETVLSFSALCAAVLCVGGMLYAAAQVERIIGRKGIVILTKLTGLVLAALSAQIAFTGAKRLWLQVE